MELPQKLHQAKGSKSSSKHAHTHIDMKGRSRMEQGEREKGLIRGDEEADWTMGRGNTRRECGRSLWFRTGRQQQPEKALSFVPPLLEDLNAEIVHAIITCQYHPISTNHVRVLLKFRCSQSEVPWFSLRTCWPGRVRALRHGDPRRCSTGRTSWCSDRSKNAWFRWRSRSGDWTQQNNCLPNATI